MYKTVKNILRIPMSYLFLQLKEAMFHTQSKYSIELPFHC